jgi:hypothetical protein
MIPVLNKWMNPIPPPISTVEPLLTDLYGENHGSDKPISRMSEGKGNVVIDTKK